MPVITSSAPANEHRQRFDTFHNYYLAWDSLFRHSYGDAPTSPLPVLFGHPGYHRLRCTSALIPQLTTYLHNAWTTETLLSLLVSLPAGEIEDAVARYSCAWVPAQAYYAVFSGLNAAARAEGQTPYSHPSVLHYASCLVAGKNRDWVPDIFNWWCSGCDDGVDGLKIKFTPSIEPIDDRTMSNLHTPRTPDEARSAAKRCLRTTRNYQCIDQAEKARARMKAAERPQSGITKAEKAKAAELLVSTTLFDYLYRLRCRCNYQDTEMFVLGATSDATSQQFVRSVVSVVSYSLCFLETVICGRIGKQNVAALVRKYVKSAGADGLRSPVAQRWGLVEVIDHLPS